MPDESNQGTATPATPSSTPASPTPSPSPAPATPSFNQPAKPGMAQTGFGASPKLANPFLGTPASPGDVPPVPAVPPHGGAAAPSGTGSSAGGQAAEVTVPVPASGGLASAAPAAAAAPALTADTLKTIVESTVRGVQQQQQDSQAAAARQAEPPMTQEQFNSHYGLPVVDAAVYEEILGTGPDKPERAQALQTLLHQSSRSAVLIAQELAKTEIQKLRNELSPIFSERQAARHKQLEDGFYTKFPEFKGEETLITELRDAHIARKTQFASIDEAYKTVADQARQIVARFRSNGSAQPAGKDRTKGGSEQPPARTMTPSSQGGRGGTGAATTKSTAEQVFGS